jgi:autotransporter strand-loop-strand O-heptosyltransferase
MDGSFPLPRIADNASRALDPAASPHPKVPATVGPEVPQILTQEGPRGIRFDFNDGARIALPPGQWRVRLRDLDTANVLFDGPSEGGVVASTKHWFIRFEMEVWEHGVSIFRHEYDARDKPVLLRFDRAIGDTIAWFSYAVQFQERHGCRMTCEMVPSLIPLFQGAYPHITLVPLGTPDPDQFYATYKVMVFFNDVKNDWQPYDYRADALHHMAGAILGLPRREARPRLAYDDPGRPLLEPYVCIAVQGSAQLKKWNNPTGWDDVVGFLKASGYRVICIDRNAVDGREHVLTSMPRGAEDQTGDKPFPERARWLKHAEFFVCVSSGLSWLGWAVGTPVVLISGFTHPHNEFHTPYRVINWHSCNSCWNDVRCHFSRTDFLWCPRQKDTPRMFECSRLITAEQVKGRIRQIPGFLGNQ